MLEIKNDFFSWGDNVDTIWGGAHCKAKPGSY